MTPIDNHIRLHTGLPQCKYSFTYSIFFTYLTLLNIVTLKSRLGITVGVKVI